MKTPDSFWTDPSADELVQRHRIHSNMYHPGAVSPSPQRPHIGKVAMKNEENPAVAPIMAREHIESLHQNSHATLLYGKNNVNVQPVSRVLFLVSAVSILYIFDIRFYILLSNVILLKMLRIDKMCNINIDQLGE